MLRRSALGRTRRAGAALLAVVAVAALAACGDDAGSGSDAGATGTEEGAFPVSIEHKYGTTEITEKPERIVVAGLVEQDALLALGEVPVGTTEWFGTRPGAIFEWAQDELGDGAEPEVLSNTDGYQFEKIAALQPDLIIGIYSGITQEDYDTLAKIAPVVAQPKDGIDYGTAWQDLTLTVGRSVGKEAQAQEIVDETEKVIADAAAAHPEFKGKTGMMATSWEGYYVYGAQDPRGRLMEQLGFVAPDGLAEVTGTEFGANLSRERIDLLDTDALVWLVTDYAKDKAAIQADPLYSQLGVKTEGRDVFLQDGELLGSATSFISVLSLPFLVEGLVPQLAEAVDGDAATPVVRSTLTPAA